MNINLETDGSYLITAKIGTVLIDPTDAHLAEQLPKDTVVVFSESSSLFSRKVKNSKWLYGPGEYELSNIRIVGMGYAAPRRTKSAYLIEADGLSVCFLGVLEAVPDPKTMQIFETVDVAVADVGNAEASTVSGGELAGILQSLEPSTIVLNGWDSAAQAPSAKLKEVLVALGSTSVEPQTKITIGAKGRADGDAARQVKVLTSFK